MSSIKVLLITILALSLGSCGNNTNTQKNKFSLKIVSLHKTISLGETITFEIKNPENIAIEKISYYLDGNEVENSINTTNILLGDHTIKANISYDNKTEEIISNFTILNNSAPKIYTYTIINEYPHDITSYTQGLEFHNGVLYESTGQYGESKLRKIKYPTGEILKNINVPNQYFAEGLTVFNDSVIQLTWQEKVGFIYESENLEKIGTFNYNQSKEGWGICNDGKQIYKSDGTENIWILDPNTLEEVSKLQACHNKGKVIELNELEWVNGKIYANRWNKNGVAIINPKNGAIEGVIDFSPLKKMVTQHQKLDVLNGIAYNPETRTLFVTGKRWDKLFEVEIIEK